MFLNFQSFQSQVVWTLKSDVLLINVLKRTQDNEMAFFVDLVLSSCLLLISEDRNATAEAVDVENKELLSSPNEYSENQTKAEEEGEGNASPSPDVLSTSPSASGNNSNQSSVDHEKMAEVIQHVVQEVRKAEVQQTVLWKRFTKVMRKKCNNHPGDVKKNNHGPHRCVLQLKQWHKRSLI